MKLKMCETVEIPSSHQIQQGTKLNFQRLWPKSVCVCVYTLLVYSVCVFFLLFSPQFQSENNTSFRKYVLYSIPVTTFFMIK